MSRAPKPRGRRRALASPIAVGAAVLVAAAGGIGGLRASGAPLCGLTAITDRVLDCPQPAPSANQQSATQQSPPPSRTTAAAATLPPTGAVIQTSTAPQFVPDTLIIRFARDTTSAQANAVLAHVGAKPIRRIARLGTLAVKLPHGTLAGALVKLRRSRLVAAATRDEVLYVLAGPNDANYGLQWGLPLARFPGAWQRTRGRRSVVVAVLDTGVNPVPDLAGNVRPGVDLTGSGATDVDGHGTAVAGVIAAHANNGIGGAGVCPNCTILPIKVMGNGGQGDLATVAQGIVKAADLHAKVIDLSLGGPVGLDALKQAVAYATAKGSIVVAAAGNSGRGTPFYPANYPGVLGVAGTTQGDRLYAWSERGTWVRVAAPGCNVAPLARGGYGMFCGTSSATPLVAGLAALALSYKPHAGNTRVVTAIEATAHRIGAAAGHGRIDAAAALARLAR